MDNSIIIRRIGQYQLWGGIIGLAFCVWALLNTEVITGPVLFIYIVICGLQAFSVYCGRRLLANQSSALAMSSINQALQVIAFAAGGCAFKYIAGVGLFAGINLTDGVNATISATISTAEISINKRPELLTLSINLIAIWLLVLLGKLQGRSSAATEA